MIEETCYSYMEKIKWCFKNESIHVSYTMTGGAVGTPSVRELQESQRTPGMAARLENDPGKMTLSEGGWAKGVGKMRCPDLIR
jgi:hypothetical protein